jgi:hypothetical protein
MKLRIAIAAAFAIAGIALAGCPREPTPPRDGASVAAPAAEPAPPATLPIPATTQPMPAETAPKPMQGTGMRAPPPEPEPATPPPPPPPVDK